MTFSIDERYLNQSTQKLVQINSINPLLSPEGKGEGEISAYVADSLNALCLDVKRSEIAPGRFNVVGTLKGSGGGRSLLLNAHMDTVGVDGMTINPFGGELKDGRIYGRGSQDMKASLAAMMATAKALVDVGITLKGDLHITGVADEEYGSLGTEALVQEVSADAAIVTEPTDMHLCRAHRGFIWFDIETFGRAAHGSRYSEGIDANMRMGRVLAELDKLEQELLTRKGHELTGPPSLHAALIKGGTEVSTYADLCLLNMERRTAPGENIDDALAEIQEIIDRLVVQDPTFKAKVERTFWREPFVVSPDAEIVQILDNALGARLGHQPAHTGQTFWTDAALFADAGMETVLLGPKGYGLHSAEEWVDMESVLDLAYILTETAIKYCG
ncbi:MAG: ArgE/DapE family deacylase [Anaerolineae bacterium]|jgi:acetylornithine deacetylase|nr:ArgE/DapE family deacylase [Anaerolineae bacterium]MBT7189361.1 ArgE/DapE family deacylase [Anaerolineae bacterium]MBT7991721.1 ArgE/DapE family deacylase [Anaerolineae bacterium]